MQHGQRGRDEARATTPLEDTKLQVSFSSPTMVSNQIIIMILDINNNC